MPPTVINVEKYLGDDPSRLIISSKSRNVNCTDTTFRVENSNGTEIESSIISFETTETPHQALLDVFADQIGTFSVNVIEIAKVDPTLVAITSYEI